MCDSCLSISSKIGHKIISVFLVTSRCAVIRFLSKNPNWSKCVCLVQQLLPVFLIEPVRCLFFPLVWLRFGVCEGLTCVAVGSLPLLSDDNISVLCLFTRFVFAALSFYGVWKLRIRKCIFKLRQGRNAEEEKLKICIKVFLSFNRSARRSRWVAHF